MLRLTRILVTFVVLVEMLGGCVYVAPHFAYHVQGSIPEPSEPWRMLSGPEANNIHAYLSKPGLGLSFYMGAKLAKPSSGVGQSDGGRLDWQSYKVVGPPFPVAVLITGGAWGGQEKFESLRLDPKKIFLVRAGTRFPAKLVFVSLKEGQGKVENRYQLEFDTELYQDDQFDLVIEDGLHTSNEIIRVPVISFKGDRGHFEIRPLIEDMFVSH
jgi:hypothetical protein